MTRRGMVGAAMTGIALMVLWGCGAAATPIPASGTPSQAAAASQAASAPSGAAPSTQASAAQPSSAGGSIAIPSFTLPSEAKDLEAVLPDEICGAKAQKASLSGASFAATANEEFKAVLAALGKQPSDVAFAFEFSQAADGCGAGIFRVSGVNQGALQQAFLAEAQKSGETYTQGTVGGKNVYISAQGSGKQYYYFAGDAVLFAQAKDDATAGPILEKLPG